MALSIGRDDVARWASQAAGEVKLIQHAIRDKGPKYFARPLILGAVMVWASYHFVYAPPKEQMRDVADKLQAVQATVQYASDYEDLRDRLSILRSKLPRTNDPEGWLLSEIRESLRQEAILPNGFSTPRLQSGPGYRLVSITINMSAGYAQLANWIARIERSRSLMHIAELHLAKATKPIGMNQVDVTVTTIVPAGEAPMGASAAGGASQ